MEGVMEFNALKRSMKVEWRRLMDTENETLRELNAKLSAKVARIREVQKKVKAAMKGQAKSDAEAKGGKKGAAKKLPMTKDSKALVVLLRKLKKQRRLLEDQIRDVKDEGGWDTSSGDEATAASVVDKWKAQIGGSSGHSGRYD